MQRIYLEGITDELGLRDPETLAEGSGFSPGSAATSGYEAASMPPVTRRTVDTGQQVIDLAAMKAELQSRKANS